MYYYLDYNEQEIEHKPYICIYLLFIDGSSHTHTVLRIFTQKDTKVLNYLNGLSLFEDDISNYVDYKVKRDGKIGLSFNKENL